LQKHACKVCSVSQSVAQYEALFMRSQWCNKGLHSRIKLTMCATYKPLISRLMGWLKHADCCELPVSSTQTVVNYLFQARGQLVQTLGGRGCGCTWGHSDALNLQKQQSSKCGYATQPGKALGGGSHRFTVMLLICRSKEAAHVIVQHSRPRHWVEEAVGPNRVMAMLSSS
jgi:hypothetical protein